MFQKPTFDENCANGESNNPNHHIIYFKDETQFELLLGITTFAQKPKNNRKS